MIGRSSSKPAHIRRAAATFLVAALVASVFIGCGGDGAQGLDRPPASLDPASPSLAAEGLAFDRAELSVPAGTPFVLVFENRETLSHNVSIYTVGGDRLFEGVLFGGPATRWYPVPALAAGTYRFVCDLHPTMAGRILAR